MTSARLPIAGEKNPNRTLVDNTPIADRIYEFVSDESGHDKLTVSKLGIHEYGGFHLYTDPHSMLWHIVDSDGNEPLGIATHKETAHKIIDAHNYEIEILDRIQSAEEERRSQKH